jgi:hypothetical protein
MRRKSWASECPTFALRSLCLVADRVVESDRRCSRGGETHGDPAITALPIAISIKGGIATADLIVNDKTTVVYGGERPLRARGVRDRFRFGTPRKCSAGKHLLATSRRRSRNKCSAAFQYTLGTARSLKSRVALPNIFETYFGVVAA